MSRLLPIIFILFAISRSEALDCGLKVNPEREQKYIKELLNSEETLACRPLAVGQKKAFLVSSAKSPTTVKHFYHLKRTSENQYDLTFNFKMLEKTKPELNSTDTWNKAYTFVWKNKANECLAQVDHKLTGPSGETLKIRVEMDTEKHKAPVAKIELVEDGRANSQKWTKKTECATIVHELMHLAGLPDEYEEKWMGYKVDLQKGQLVEVTEGAEILAFNCRTTHEKSVMANQHEIWNEMMASYKFTTEFCMCENPIQCEKYKSERKELFNKYFDAQNNPKVSLNDIPPEVKKNPEACPLGFKANPKFTQTSLLTNEPIGPMYIGMALPEGLKPEDTFNMILTQKTSKRTEQEKIVKMEQRHWNAIIFPGCLAKNGDYYKEAQQAYKTSLLPNKKNCY